MTALKNYANILKIYNESRTNYLKLVFFKQKIAYSWKPWLILIATAALMLYHSIQPESLQQNLYTFIGLISSAIGLFLTTEEARARKFRKIYKKHKIKKHPLINRQQLVRYAVFLRKLKKQNHTIESIEKSIASIKSCTPPETSSTTQNIIITTLLAALVTITANLLEKTSLWTDGKGFLFILYILAMLYISWIIATIIKERKAQTLTIIRLLERAKIDLQD
ncbi:hypothetical protein ACT048_23145 [Ectopseudomonas khazarica]|uniref:hypothetical protein n=1 Tax=Ectopseudomonas khazarica TaxID=2502979 RepID=UPI004033E285